MQKNLLILSLFFFLIFFWYSSVQQLLTTYYVDIGYPKVGFYSLSFIYIGFFLSSLFLSKYIKKIWIKSSMLYASFFYSLFMFSILFQNIILLYITSFLLWIAATYLWVAQQVYLLQISKNQDIGKNSGIFNIFLSVWSVLWLLSIWYMISEIGYYLTFLFYGCFPAIALLIWYFLQNDKIQEREELDKQSDSWSIRYYFQDIELLSIWFIMFLISFLSGLYFSVIPIHIWDIYWKEFIWTISALYYLSTILLWYGLWKFIDSYNMKLIIYITYFISLVSLIFLYIGFLYPLFFMLWVITTGITCALLFPLRWKLIVHFSKNKSIHKLSIFFIILYNLWLITAIILSSYIETQFIYIITLCLCIISFGQTLRIYAQKNS